MKVDKKKIGWIFRLMLAAVSFSLQAAHVEVEVPRENVLVESKPKEPSNANFFQMVKRNLQERWQKLRTSTKTSKKSSTPTKISTQNQQRVEVAGDDSKVADKTLSKKEEAAIKKEGKRGSFFSFLKKKSPDVETTPIGGIKKRLIAGRFRDEINAMKDVLKDLEYKAKNVLQPLTAFQDSAVDMHSAERKEKYAAIKKACDENRMQITRQRDIITRRLKLFEQEEKALDGELEEARLSNRQPNLEPFVKFLKEASPEAARAGKGISSKETVILDVTAQSSEA